MNKILRPFVKQIVSNLLIAASRTPIGKYIVNQSLSTAMQKERTVIHDGLILRFVVPNALCDWRARTFSEKEPETLAWIDKIPENSIFWDIGANIGLYSVYAASRRNCRVWSFEPSIFNLELLGRNIFCNNLVDRVCIVPFPLSDSIGSSSLRLTTTAWGGALSTFGQGFGWNGKPIDQVFAYKIVGLPLDGARDLLQIPQPDFIKLDVDGIEHLILKGGSSVLQRVQQVLIEVNDDFAEQSDKCVELLTHAGLRMRDKLHSEMLDSSNTGFQNSYNQIWTRY